MWRPKAHAVLTKEQAINIFLQKNSTGFASQAQKCAAIASAYSISVKTVRDIWCGRSWLEVTYDLWEVRTRSRVKSNSFVRYTFSIEKTQNVGTLLASSYSDRGLQH